uniref:Tudor domain-containing protein 1 n=2 Tax=Melanaphis sacchari TaxID=742174 RepID=A0A2H8TQY2_9HEMI
MLNSDDTNRVKCSLIDIGQIDKIPPQNIFLLPNYVSLNKVPNMVRRVTLAGLNKILNTKITSYLSLLKGKTYTMEYKKKSDQWHKQEVILKELQSNLSINDEIQKLFSNDASFVPPISQQRRLERKIIMPETKESILEKPSHPIKSGSSVFITNFENFNSIFIRDASYEFIENFNTFNKDMLKYYRTATNKIPKENLKVGDKVCVENSLLNLVMYSRALIIDIIDNEYNVFYLDYGNTELVNVEDIIDLPKELEKFQDFVIKVQLQNMPPLNTKNDIQVIKNHFKKKFITPNAKLSIEFNEFNPKGLDDVVLRTEYYKKDIVEDIRDLLNAPPLSIKITGQNKNTEQPNSSHGIFPYPARRLL